MRVQRRRQRRRQAGVEHIFDAERQPCDIAAIGADHRRNASVGGADHRQALLDGAQPRLRQMLIGASCLAEPAVIGKIEQQAGAPRVMRALRGGGLFGKNRLIAD